MTSCYVLLTVLCCLFTRKQKQFCAQQAIDFSLFFLLVSTAFPCRGGVKGWCSLWVLTGHHPFNVELCFSFKAKNKCSWRNKQTWKEVSDTWKTRLLCVSQSKEPVHKEVTLLEKHEPCDAAKVSRCPAEQWAFKADMLWERGTFFSHPKVFSSVLAVRWGKERKLLCSAISSLSTEFDHAPVCQWKIASIYLGWQHGLTAVVASLSRCPGKQGQCCCRSAAEEAAKARMCVTGRAPEWFLRDWGKSVSGSKAHC